MDNPKYAMKKLSDLYYKHEKVERVDSVMCPSFLLVMIFFKNIKKVLNHSRSHYHYHIIIAVTSVSQLWEL